MKLTFEIDVNDKNNIHQTIDVLMRLMSTVPKPKTIYELDLTQREINCLKSESIETVDELLRWSAYELLKTPNFGRKSLNLLREKLANHGLVLRGES